VSAVDVLKLYFSTRVLAPSCVVDVATLSPQLEWPGLPVVAPAPSPVAAAAAATVTPVSSSRHNDRDDDDDDDRDGDDDDDARDDDGSARGNEGDVREDLADRAVSDEPVSPSRPVVLRKLSSHDLTPEQLESAWLKAVAQAKPSHEASVIRAYLERTLRDATTPFGQLLQNFVRAKFKAKCSLRDQKQQQQQQQQQQSAQIVDLFMDSPAAAAAAPVAANKLDNSCETAQTFVDDLVATIARRHRILRSSATRLAAVTAAVETVLYSQTQELYAATFAEQDAELSAKLAKLVTLSPAHLNIPQRFWLLSPDSSEPPYNSAIEILRSIPRLSTPAAQLRALVDTCAAIDAAIKQRARDENWSAQGLDSNVTADLLLPLLTYVVLRSRVPRLHSLSKYLEDFISESDEIHETGYVLVTFQCILAAARELDSPEALNNKSLTFDVNAFAPSLQK